MNHNPIKCSKHSQRAQGDMWWNPTQTPLSAWFFMLWAKIGHKQSLLLLSISHTLCQQAMSKTNPFIDQSTRSNQPHQPTTSLPTPLHRQRTIPLVMHAKAHPLQHRAPASLLQPPKHHALCQQAMSNISHSKAHQLQRSTHLAYNSPSNTQALSRNDTSSCM